MFGKIKRFKNLIQKFYCRMSSDRWLNYLRAQGMKIGEGTAIFANPAYVLIDVTRPWMIEIGKNVQITRDVKILTHDYSYSVSIAAYGKVLGSCGKVKIGDNCFIGVGATILKGTQIGNNVIIGAGSVVTGGNFPSDCVIAGNPARVICSLSDYFKKRLELQVAEAEELVAQYYSAYHSLPTENVLDEFFWIFAPRNNESVKKYEHRLKLMNNYDATVSEFLKSEPLFDSYNDFIAHCAAKINIKTDE